MKKCKKKLATIMAAILLACLLAALSFGLVGCGMFLYNIDIQAHTYHIDEETGERIVTPIEGSTVRLGYSIVYHGGGVETVRIRNFDDRLGVNVLVIPDYIRGRRVTTIYDFGVVNTEQLHGIVIGEYVTSIGDWAFKNNLNLRWFSVHEDNQYFWSEPSFDDALFARADGGRIVDIDEADRLEGSKLLFYPTGNSRVRWREISFSQGFAQTTAGFNSFGSLVGGLRDATRDELINLRNTNPNNVNIASLGVGLSRSRRIREGNRDFNLSLRDVLVTVSVPEGVVEIGMNAFFRNWYVGEVVLPSSLVSIGDQAFLGSERLVVVGKNEGLQRIGNDAFLGCISLIYVEIPESVGVDLAQGERGVGSFVWMNAWRVVVLRVQNTQAHTVASWHSQWHLRGHGRSVTEDDENVGLFARGARFILDRDGELFRW